MKLLIITYSYAPDLTPRAFRWSAVAERLAAMGHDVQVLCAAASGSPLLEANNGVTVHRVRDWLLNASSRVMAGAPVPRPAGSRVGSFAIRGALRNAVRGLWRLLHWPDYACGWLIPAIREGRRICARNQFDWIISVSHPFTGHLVGMLVKDYAPAANWLVDIGDPFFLMKEPSPNNRRLYGWLSRWIERRVVVGADILSVTTESTGRLYESHFALPHAKVWVVPPLLSLPAMPAPRAREADQPIRLVFVGTLYRNLRSPKFMLSCLSALAERLGKQRLELHIYGAINDCASDLESCPEPLKSALSLHGMVERTAVLQAMVDADILVNIGNDSETQLASKVIEYMAVGRPILNFEGYHRTVSASVLAMYPASLTVTRSNDSPTPETIETVRSFVLSPPLVEEGRVAEIKDEYSCTRIAALYEKMLLN